MGLLKLIKMKQLIIAIAASLLMFCGCSPKISGNIQTVPAEHPDYAVIYFYRPAGYVQTPYNVHLGNEVVFRSKNRNRCIYKVDKPGSYEIWGKTESREGIVLNVEMGKEYYVLADVKFGVALWRPYIQHVSPETGKADWDAIK